MGRSKDGALELDDYLLRVDVEQPAPRTVLVRVAGELDVLTSGPLGEKLDRLLRVEVPVRLVLDISQVTLLAAAALRLLVRLQRRCCHEGVHLALVGIDHPTTIRPLQITQLLPLFDVYPTVAAALHYRRHHRAQPPVGVRHGRSRPGPHSRLL